MPEVRLPFQMVLPEDLCGLSYLFEKAGFQLYVVGGAVRDAVMGVKPKDFDVATDATPDQVIRLLRDIRAWSINEVGKSFGVVKVHLRDSDHEYEIATFRQDIGAGRRPDSVVFTTIEEDVKRRDLTINALFYDIQRAEVVDLVGGLEDMKRGIIRTVGDPYERFTEDRLRVLRCMRFACKLQGYAIEEETYQAIKHDNNLNGVSAERIRDEFTKSVHSTHNVNVLLRCLDAYDMWGRVFPGLNVTMRSMRTRSVPVILALLLEGNTPAHVGQRLNELKYSAEEVAQVTFLLQYRLLEASGAYRLRKLFKTGHVPIEMMSEYVRERGLPVVGLQVAFSGYLNLEPVKGDNLLAQGYSGRALGVELERREVELFKGML